MLTDREKDNIKFKLLETRMSGHGFWEVWSSGDAPEYGPNANPARLREICEGTYEEVVEYALNQFWFWDRSNHDNHFIIYGQIKPFPTPVVKVWKDALREEKIKKLERERSDLDKKIAQLQQERG